MGKLAGRVAVITAAADGIGAVTAETLAGEGATVVITDINVPGARALAAKIGGQALALEHDAGDEQAWRSVMNTVKERFGRLDVLVNNAGGSGAGTIESIKPQELRDALRLNLESTFIGCQLAIEMMKNKGGSIVNVSSVLGVRASPNAAAYSAAKGGVRLLTKSVALHCAENRYNVRCNSVHPGYILTTQTKKWFDEQPNGAELLADVVRKHPIGFLGDSADIAKGILYLASDDARFVTGIELMIDGGFTL
jgi:NAD(P)-dependent dehydrogenase (short-subunit alcohol dehydrogenase family)